MLTSLKIIRISENFLPPLLNSQPNIVNTANMTVNLTPFGGTTTIGKYATSSLTVNGGNVVITGSTSTDLVRITQTGTGNAFVVEDASNPDSTAFVIDTSGNVAIGKTTASVKLDVVGAGAFSGAVTGSTFNALTLTAAATGFTIAGGTTSKTLTINNTLSFSGTDSTVMTFPSTSQTIVGLTSTQTMTNKSLSDSTTYIVDATDKLYTLFNTIGCVILNVEVTV